MSYYSYRQILTDEYYDGKPLEIGKGPQLLTSEIIVEDAYRVVNEQQTAIRYKDNPIMVVDKEWETDVSDPCVLYDEKIGKYRMWYTSFSEDFHGAYVAYAESNDGVHFEKPITRVTEYRGSYDNNIVFTGRGDGAIIGRVIFNPDITDIERRFIMIWGDGKGLSLAYSKDGIHFEMCMDPEIILSVSMDCRIIFGYDETAKEWIVFTRPTMYAKNEDLPPESEVCANGNYRRRVCVMKSKDLRHFTSPRIIYRAPENYACTEADNINFFTVGDYPMAFIHMFRADNVDDCRHQRMLPNIAMGRDVFSLKTNLLEKPIIEMGRNLSYDDNRVCIDSPPFDLFGDDRSYFYGRGMDARKGEINIALFSFEKDRYIAATADIYGGWLLTREFYFRGSYIEIDADVPENGEVKVEILEGDHGQVRGGRALVGYTLSDCDVVRGDSHKHRLTFGGSDDLSSLVGRAVYLRFHIVNAKLYSFKVLD